MIINTRQDLDAIQGSEEHTQFISYLKGSMAKQVDTQVYPDGYNQLDYAGVKLEPIWVTVEDLTTITSFGFAKGEL